MSTDGTSTTTTSGEVRELGPDEHPAGETECGTCGRRWDDDISTSMTPAPSGRCPFEYDHEEEDEDEGQDATLYVEETWINRTEGHMIGESGIYASCFDYDERGKLYRESQREYGRCISKVYVDGPNGRPVPIGWVFQGRDKYEDTGETYLRETWVTLHTAPPTVTRTPHYLPLDK